ncbi:RDD family protein [Streptomyces spinosisporus]|uniref:RDD family protein n=1 Tax=Streptomyces spinosisporus TaxID=2927582 RepID=A0ABS9XFS0_9ACTN|nr:RDD family protein [Streptomyces spinosisporus]MCI3240938.1 RDD family protein [Streptomyces spinosisporus]
MSELVTGEAVALELRPARLPSRALAVLLDLGVAMVVYIVLTIALVASTASLDDAAQIAVSIAGFVLVLVGGPIAVETLSHGRSLGKLACGLRVVLDDGGPIRFRHALVRGGIGVVEILMTFGVVACIASLVSARGRRLGDVFAGTLVVRERVPVGRTGFLPPPPPWLAGRFSELDLSAVPDGLWLAVRQYLTRMQQLDPQVGWAMAERLASDLADRTGAPIPQGVPPAAFLAAVVQERQAREVRRAYANGSAAGSPSAGAPGSYGPPAWSPPVPPSAADVARPTPVGPQGGAPSYAAPVYGTPTPTSPQNGAPVGHPSDAASGTVEADGSAESEASTGFAPPA